MNIRRGKNEITMDERRLTKIDQFVLDFIDAAQNYGRYVIVSGYVSILFGRSRGTEGIDIIIERIDSTRFHSLHGSLVFNGFYFLNPESESGLFEILEEGLGIRAAIERTIIPNIEIKFAKDDFDKYSLENRQRVLVNNNILFISPLELQIPYKLWLGSEKDIEDAIFLWELFKETIDPELLSTFMNELGVTGDEHGIEIRSKEESQGEEGIRPIPGQMGEVHAQ